MNPLFSQPGVRTYFESVALAMWAVIAYFCRDFAPWIFWFTMVALPLTAIVLSETKYLTSPAGVRILQLCAAMLVVHIAWAIGRSFFYDAAQPGTYWKDDHNYFREAAAIAKSWGNGNYPEIWLKGSPPYLGTLHTGYHRPLSTLFLLFGPATIWGLVLNAVCAALIPLFAGLCSRYLWDPGSPGSTPLKTDYGFLGAALAALHPVQFYWASYLMKDTFVAFVFLSGMTLVLGAYRKRSFSLGVGAILVIPFMFTVRAYTAMSLLAGAVLLPFMKVSRQVLLRTAFAASGLLVLFCVYTTSGNAVYRQLRDSFTALAPSEIGTPIQLLSQMAGGIPRLFLAPYAWLILSEPTPMYGMYPGMWYLYLLGYPLAFSGLYAAIKRNVTAAAVPLAVFGLSALVFLSPVYQGEASRQRYSLEYIMLIFAAYGLRNFSRWWAFSVVGLEAAFAIGQILSLR